MQRKAQITGDTLSVPQAQRRRPPPSLAQIAERAAGRDPAIVTAYATGAYTYREIAAYFGVHLATVGRLVRRAMQKCADAAPLTLLSRTHPRRGFFLLPRRHVIVVPRATPPSPLRVTHAQHR
jgi:hypothetical protein